MVAILESRAVSARQKLVQFWLNVPGYPRDRIKVLVFPTKKAMITGAERRGDGEAGVFEALCAPYHHINFEKGKKVSSRFSARLYFYRDFIGIGCVTHEILHATLDWAMAKKLNPMKEGDGTWVCRDNEAMCVVHGELVRQFSVKAFKHRVWR